MSANRMRYSVNDVASNRFYQLPVFLFEGEFKGNNLSNNARVLYSLLKDRHALSLKNNWYDENGAVYLLYTRKNMEDMLGVSYKTVKKAVDQLIEVGLIEEEYVGLNQPNKIYLTHVDYESLDNKGVGDFPIPEVENLPSREWRISHPGSGESPT